MHLKTKLNIAARVSHPNVCRLYDVIVLPTGPCFLTMDFIDGETLSARLRRGPMGKTEAYSIATQIINGLEAAHRLNIIHRDLKPANVMLTNEGVSVRAVITDFGLARQIEPGSDLRTALSGDLFVGTPAYMSPEQLRGKLA